MLKPIALYVLTTQLYRYRPAEYPRLLQISDGGVHSHQEHLYALLEAAKEAGVPEVYIHFFGDGRDTSPRSAVGYLESLLAKLQEPTSCGKLSTITGRYYAMDRDKRWERIKVAVNGLVQGEGEETSDPVQVRGNKKSLWDVL